MKRNKSFIFKAKNLEAVADLQNPKSKKKKRIMCKFTTL